MSNTRKLEMKEYDTQGLMTRFNMVHDRAMEAVEFLLGEKRFNLQGFDLYRLPGDLATQTAVLRMDTGESLDYQHVIATMVAGSETRVNPNLRQLPRGFSRLELCVGYFRQGPGEERTFEGSLIYTHSGNEAFIRSQMGPHVLAVGLGVFGIEAWIGKQSDNASLPPTRDIDFINQGETRWSHSPDLIADHSILLPPEALYPMEDLESVLDTLSPSMFGQPTTRRHFHPLEPWAVDALLRGR